MAHYHIDHLTTYQYNTPTGVSAHLLHVKPRNTARQKLNKFTLNIQPRPSDLCTAIDYFSNDTHFFSIQEMHPMLKVHVKSDVSVEPFVAPEPWATPTCEDTRRYMRSLKPGTTWMVEQFSYPSTYVPIVDGAHRLARDLLLDNQPILSAAIKLCQRIYEDFEFDPNATDISTPLHEILKIKRGVCQDFAHLMLACLRAFGLPALYVSGYLLTSPPPGKPRLIGADASHAWVSVYVPEFGWIDIDPTNNKIPTDEHITIAYGRDYSDVSLIRGEFTGSKKHNLDVEVTVTPV